VLGDEGTAVVQVSKSGALIDSMDLSGFEDTEGIAYAGEGEFVFTEERQRQLVKFEYVAGGRLERAATKTVKLGTTIRRRRARGPDQRPRKRRASSSSKEMNPEGIFQTGVDWDAGTATNGSPSSEASTNLFDPALAGTLDFSRRFRPLQPRRAERPGKEPPADHQPGIGPDRQPRPRRQRQQLADLGPDADNPLPIPAQTDEGVTMDEDGNLYVVNESGGGDSSHP
jgi:uncharacterized protein YjiK